jgi:glycine dehydrogenase subunit 1
MNYIPNTDAELQAMLDSIGVKDFEQLLGAIPSSLRFRDQLNIPEALSEPDLVKHLTGLSLKNKQYKSCFAGGGAYDHFIPSIIWRLVSRSEFITAYTPYQAEVAQGTLQATYEFQSMVSHLVNLPITNASMYDGATAMAEAAILAARHTDRNQILVAGTVNPYYLETMRTYLVGTGIQLVNVPVVDGLVDANFLQSHLNEKIAAVIIQSPNFLGLIESIEEIAMDIKKCGALLIMGYDPISLGILKTPGEYGADIAVAEGQGLGIPLSYGGPYLGLFSVRADLVRRMPGRLVAKTVDANGKTGFVLTLQTREQHIRREKATSNICTNEQLYALMATVYLAMMGKGGMKHVAELCLAKAHYASQKISSLPGYKLRFKSPFFKEFVVQTPVTPKRIISHLGKYDILGGIDIGAFKFGLKGCLMIAVTEKVSYEQIDELAYWLTKVK